MIHHTINQLSLHCALKLSYFSALPPGRMWMVLRHLVLLNFLIWLSYASGHVSSTLSSFLLKRIDNEKWYKFCSNSACAALLPIPNSSDEMTLYFHPRTNEDECSSTAFSCISHFKVIHTYGSTYFCSTPIPLMKTQLCLWSTKVHLPRAHHEWKRSSLYLLFYSTPSAKTNQKQFSLLHLLSFTCVLVGILFWCPHLAISTFPVTEMAMNSLASLSPKDFLHLWW